MQVVWIAWALVAALAASLAACSPEESEEEAGPEVPSVEAVPARYGTLPLEERVSGVVKAEGQVAIRPEISAPVVEVMVRSGDSVQKGQPLVRLDSQALREQLRQAEADVSLAEASEDEAQARVAELEAQVTRTRALAEEDLVSQMDLETQEAQLQAARASARQAAARVEQARATLQERRSDLSRTVVRSPVTGRVGQRNAEVGMLASPNTDLFQVGDLGDLKVEVPLTEEMLSYVEEGQRVRISSSSLGDESFEASLSRISPFLDTGSFSTVGEIDLAGASPGEERLRPGMFVTVDILYGESEQATLVPTSSLWEDPRTGVLGVFVIADGGGLSEGAEPSGRLSEAAPRAVAQRSVEVLAEGRATVGVSGVEPDEWVVTVGQHLLEDGGEARVRAARWEDVLGLQDLQREDLLAGFLDKQQRLAKSVGAVPPEAGQEIDGGVEGGSGEGRAGDGEAAGDDPDDPSGAGSRAGSGAGSRDGSAE